LVGRVVVVTTTRGSFSNRDPNISMSQASGYRQLPSSLHRGIMLRPAQACGLVGAVERPDGAVRPGRRFNGS
jgi:hypothetical protein